ncbi:MAG: hypothetical protein K4304_08290 [Propionicimonas sp.]|jgi:hypothetical protein
MTSPLVATPVDTATPFSGAFLIEDGQMLADAIESGNWVEGGVAAFASVLDAAAFITDPIGTLIANGLGWVLDHIEPLKGWMNDFTGDAGEVAAFAQTWHNVGTRMYDSGAALAAATKDLDAMSGATIDAYLAYAGDAIKQLNATGDWANAIGQGMEIASYLVQIVHDLVRDAVSQIVGTAISVALEMALTAGLATPVAVEQITTKVGSLATKVGRSVERLLRAFRKLNELLDALRALFDRGGAFIKKLLHGDAPASALPVKTSQFDRVNAVRSDGMDLAPGETRTTMRGWTLRRPTDDQIERLDKLANTPGSGVEKVGDVYRFSDPIDVHFDKDTYFKEKGIKPDDECLPGVTWAEEYDRQLAKQQSGMNDLTQGEWKHNVAHYETHDRMGGSAQTTARAEYGGKAGDGTAVLHGPDQVAGGRPDVFDGLGSSRVNSSIGGRWPSRVIDLREDVDAAARGIDPDLLSFIHLNTRLLP